MPQHRTVLRVCRQCGRDFMAEIAQIKRNRHKFCSVACRCTAHRRPLPVATLSEDGLTALIPLYAHGGAIRAYTAVDVDDAAWVCQWRWAYGKGRPQRGIKVDGKPRTIYLHRELLGLIYGDDTEGDHRDRDPLNNRRSNLRPLTLAGNLQNKSSYRGSSSAYRGVHWDKKSAMWLAQIQASGKKTYLGRFSTEIEAAKAARAARARMMPYAID